MRLRLGGLVVALALGASACGSDGGTDAAPAAAAASGAELVADLVSARDTLPPAPPSASALTVVLTHPGGATDPGLDAAAAALAQRPDIDVVIAAPAGTGEQTMSGFPVDVVGATAADAVAAAIDEVGEADLVVVGIHDGHGIGAPSPEAYAATERDVAALVVGAEHGDPPDLAAAAMQVLEVLDLELESLLPGDAHRLTVPSCAQGMLRGRRTTRTGDAPAPELRADCTSDDTPSDREADAFALGYATLTRLP